ncbi:MAG: hypothetical protein HQK96_03920 [Nitrospirae bacterium]|nr:hypothetical protein [Nitrospirota bacterium]
MAVTNIFLLLAETKPSYNWTLNNEPFQDDEPLGHYFEIINSAIKQIKEKINDEVKDKLRDEIKRECLIGYYDENNARNFLECYKGDEKKYSINQLSFLRKIVYNNLENWRDDSKQSPDKEYKLFNKSTIKNHTFCEMSQRIVNIREINYALLNHYACSIDTDEIPVTIEGGATVKVFNLQTKNSGSLAKWLVNTIIQKRIFNLNPKHGENGRGNQPRQAVLECSKENAQDLLNTAIGGSGNKLFNYDKTHDKYIVFMDEKHNECEKSYHGYHVDLNSTDVPQSIKNRFDTKMCS